MGKRERGGGRETGGRQGDGRQVDGRQGERRETGRKKDRETGDVVRGQQGGPPTSEMLGIPTIFSSRHPSTSNFF